MSNLNEKQRKLFEHMKKDHAQMGKVIADIEKGIKEGTVDGEKFEELISKETIFGGKISV